MLVFNLVVDKGFVRALDDGALSLETATVYKPVGSLIRVESFHAFDAHMLGQDESWKRRDAENAEALRPAFSAISAPPRFKNPIMTAMGLTMAQRIQSV